MQMAHYKLTIIIIIKTVLIMRDDSHVCDRIINL